MTQPLHNHPTGPDAARHILHPASAITALERDGPRIMTSGHGVMVQEDNGHQAIDGTAGLWCVNLGHNRPEIAATMTEAAGQLDYFHSFNGHSNRAQIALADRLIEMAPPGLEKVFFGSSGSDANDTILKIIWHVSNLRGRPEKKKIISRWQAYHGTSLSTASLTGLKGFHTQFDLPLDRVLHTTCPHHYAHAHPGEDEGAFTARLLRELEDLILAEGPETIAAFIGEPIMGAGGVIIPPEGYWAGVQALCRKYELFLIADEVVCGFGRTGKMFGSDLFDVRPDFMATAKGLTSGTFPLSATFIGAEIVETLREGARQLGGFSHGYTYSGHPIGCAVANTVLDILEREALVENAAETGAYLQNALRDRLGDHPHIGEIRGAGLLIGLQLMTERDAKVFPDPAEKLPAQVAQACYDAGLIIRPLPSVGTLALSPPLTLRRAEADQIVARLEAGLQAVFGPVKGTMATAV